jgi:membrane associated rhomboid family serine protease
MLLVPTVVEPAAEPLPPHATPVVWIWLALVLAVFAAERLVVFDHDLGLGLFPSVLFAGVTFTIASWTLYGDPALFDLWQLWSHLLVHPRWWQLAVEVVLMLAVGRALERLLGLVLFLAVLGCLAPLGGVLMVLVADQPFYAGGLPLSAGLLGVALGRLPAAVVRFDVVWWLVVAVGHWPLFRLPLHTLLILLLVFILASTGAGAVTTLFATVAVAAIGLALGTLIRRRAALSVG